MGMYQDIDSTRAVQAQRLEDTGYSLTAAEREHLDKRHRFWAAVTLLVCFASLVFLVAYPTIARSLHA